MRLRCACGYVARLQSDVDRHVVACRPFWEALLARRVARLARLRELDAPDEILASEERLVEAARAGLRRSMS